MVNSIVCMKLYERPVSNHKLLQLFAGRHPPAVGTANRMPVGDYLRVFCLGNINVKIAMTRLLLTMLYGSTKWKS